MRRTLLLLAALLAARPAAAQPLIQPGSTARGELTTSDARLELGAHYDVWRMDVQPGHVYLVTLRSADFDAFLTVGRPPVARCGNCPSDDDGAGGTDAAVRITPDSAVSYQIRASAYREGATGGYELVVEDEGVPAPGPHDTLSVRAGDTVTGRLEPGDETMHNGMYSDTWLYEGKEGETVVVTLRSEDFDTEVAMGLPTHSGCRPIDSDDDGGGGTDSELTTVLRRAGTHHIHVRSSQVRGRGAYTLSVRSESRK